VSTSSKIELISIIFLIKNIIEFFEKLFILFHVKRKQFEDLKKNTHSIQIQIRDRENELQLL
jgi:nitrogen fixation-related uncharacterized protein